MNGLIGTRRGAPLGFDGRDGWRGWDTVRAEMPLSEVTDLIVDLRSLTQGVGTFEMEFDHLAELNGKLADQVVATHRRRRERERHESENGKRPEALSRRLALRERDATPK